MVNRLPTSTLVIKIPHESCTGKNTYLKHLIVFVCDAFVHVPKENRSKLDNKYEKNIFISYKDGIKCYKLWNPVTKKIVYSQDVEFREVRVLLKNEDQPKKEEPKSIEFELEGDESKSIEEN